MEEDKRTYQLNTKQRHLLILLYKFRFATVTQLTDYLDLKANSTLNRNLKLLVDKRLVGRYYKESFRIDRKHAVYYLAKEGIRTLREDERLDMAVLNSYYKNRQLSESFMRHHVDALAVYNALRTSYGDTYDIFTKQELTGFDELPDTLPDVYMRGEKEAFIILAHDVQPFIYRKWLAEYIEHSEEEGWPSGKYPALLFVLADATQERRFLEFAAKSLESAGIPDEELNISACTITALLRKPYQPVL